jgi:hypothetical protein
MKMTKVKISKEIEISKEDYKYLRDLLYKWGICKDEKCVKRKLIEYFFEEDEEDDSNYQEEDFEEEEDSIYCFDYICDSDIEESSDYDYQEDFQEDDFY